MHSKAIDQIRTRVWITEIRSLTGLQAVHALAAHLDPESTWKDGSGIPHQSKWYRYEKGDATPSEALTSKVKAALPDLSFDIHHPAWTLLRKPAPSQKTIERLVQAMPLQWRQTLQQLQSDAFEFRRIGLELVIKYKLAQMTYLDAFLLFELGRRNALDERAAGKDENLTFIILALPLLYFEDPLWALQNAEQKKCTLHAILRSLKLSGDYFKGICFPRDRLVQGMAMQRVLQSRYVANHPRALNTREKRIRFLAGCMGNKSDDCYAIATSAFIKENDLQRRLRSLIFGPDPYAQSVWHRAWNQLKHGPDFSHFSQCLKKSPATI